MVLAFSGHRPERLPWGNAESDPRCQALRLTISKRLRRISAAGYDRFLCGMARGCDFYFAEEVLNLRSEIPQLRLTAVLPCASQADGWRFADQARYRDLCRRCDDVILLQEAYTKDCMLRRNQWMVEHADLLMTVYDGCGGGTGHAVRCARQAGLPIWPIWL